MRLPHPALSAVAGSRVHRAGVPLGDCRPRHGFRRASPEVTGNRLQAPRAVHEQGLLAAEHSVGPQTGQCRDPGSTIADSERLVIDANLERTEQAPDRHVRAPNLLEHANAERPGRTSQ